MATGFEAGSLKAKCDAYLRSRHCTLWGQSFEIISPKGRAEAVAWLVEVLEGVASFDQVDVAEEAKRISAYVKRENDNG